MKKLVRLTLIEACTPAQATKTVSVSEEGAVSVSAAMPLGAGHATTRDLDLHGLVDLLNEPGDNLFLQGQLKSPFFEQSLGGKRCEVHTKGQVQKLIKDDESEVTGLNDVLRRCRDHFETVNSDADGAANMSGVCVLDVDTRMTYDAAKDFVRESLGGDFTYVIKPSASSGVVVDGVAVDDPAAGNKWHVYVPMTEPYPLRALKSAMNTMQWVQGHGFILVSKGIVPMLLPRTKIDTAVFQEERLIYEAPLLCSVTGGHKVTLGRRPAELVNGDGQWFSPSDFCSAAAGRESEVRGLIRGAKGAKDICRELGKRNKVARPEFIKRAGAAAAGVFSVIPEAEAIEEAEKRYVALRRGLVPTSHMVQQDRVGEVTVGYLVNKGMERAGRAGRAGDDYRCFINDPYEPGYRGTENTKLAEFRYNSGKPIIKSLAHGGVVYEVVYDYSFIKDTLLEAGRDADEPRGWRIKRHLSDVNARHRLLSSFYVSPAEAQDIANVLCADKKAKEFLGLVVAPRAFGKEIVAHAHGNLNNPTEVPNDTGDLKDDAFLKVYVTPHMNSDLLMLYGNTDYMYTGAGFFQPVDGNKIVYQSICENLERMSEGHFTADANEYKSLKDHYYSSQRLSQQESSKWRSLGDIAGEGACYGRDLICFEDCTYEWRTGQVHEHSEAHGLRSGIKCELPAELHSDGMAGGRTVDIQEAAPMFFVLLKGMLLRTDDGSEVDMSYHSIGDESSCVGGRLSFACGLNIVRYAIYLAMTRQACHYAQKVLFLYGGAGCGKSSLDELLRCLVGDGNHVAISQGHIVKNEGQSGFEAAQQRDKHVMSMEDCSFATTAARTHTTTFIKQSTSQGRFNAEKKNVQSADDGSDALYRTPLVVLSSNEKLSSNTEDISVERRMLVVTCQKYWTGDVDDQLVSRIVKAERSALIAWGLSINSAEIAAARGTNYWPATKRNVMWWNYYLSNEKSAVILPYMEPVEGATVWAPELRAIAGIMAGAKQVSEQFGGLGLSNDVDTSAWTTLHKQQSNFMYVCKALTAATGHATDAFKGANNIKYLEGYKLDYDSMLAKAAATHTVGDFNTIVSTVYKTLCNNNNMRAFPVSYLRDRLKELVQPQGAKDES